MLRSLVALLVLALPLAAAPVPKQIKKPVPELVGTTWATPHGGDDVEYTFQDGGEYTSVLRGRVYYCGSWKLDGDVLEWEVGGNYATYKLTFKDGVFEGTARTPNGAKSWPVTLRPKDAK